MTPVTVANLQRIAQKRKESKFRNGLVKVRAKDFDLIETLWRDLKRAVHEQMPGNLNESLGFLLIFSTIKFMSFLQK